MEYRPEVKEFYAREKLISTLRNRFKTYGYYQINTPTFESYDLYSNVQGTIPKDEMLKVISPNGKVLVLRPDVTIPVTQLVTLPITDKPYESRFSYITNVFRSSFGMNEGYTKMQAGVEFFGNTSTDAEMEIISLAMECLTDLGFEDFKLEIGHAGVVSEILEYLKLPPDLEKQFKLLIHSKNNVGLEEFLTTLNISPSIKNTIKTVPFLYGKSQEVLNRALTLSLTDNMTMMLERLLEVTEMLQTYGFEDDIVIDLGLISHMEYYSGLIFQGFIQEIGKPILLGGRYDHLAEQFTNATPAIGFAFDLESLLEASPSLPCIPEPISVQYDDEGRSKALKLVKQLRDLNYPVTMNLASIQRSTGSYVVSIKASGNTFSDKESVHSFTTIDELLPMIRTLPCNVL